MRAGEQVGDDGAGASLGLALPQHVREERLT
jgi:hypothetical protein